MKITSKHLRNIIREEYLRSTPPTRPGQMMSEARANLVAEEMLEEGLFDTIKAGFAALKGGASKAAEKMGDEASKALAPATKAIAQVASAAKSAAQGVADTVGKIKDEALKAAAESARTSLQNSLKSALQKSLADGLKNLTSAGMDEASAKTLISSIASAEIASLVGSSGGQ